jgi:hypothetical protein
MAADQAYFDPSDELIGKTVGRRGPPRALEDVTRDSKESAAAWSRALETPFVPRGVYRFRTHEEADAWLWAMITRTERRR